MIQKKVEKWTKWVIEQMFSDNKKLRNEEKHFIKNHKTLYNIRTDTRISNYRVASLLKTADSDCHQTSYKYINQFRKKVYSMQSSSMNLNMM